MNYYILILEEKVKSFSLVGHGEKCAVSLMLKGYANPLNTLAEGDKVVGYVAGTVKTFCYLFDVGFDQSTQQLYFEKIFETKMGAKLTAVSSDLQEIINAREQTESFINITGEQYRQIMSLMMNMVSSWGNKAIEKSEEREIDEENRIDGGTNILLYGVPGSGKSWTIEHEYCHKDSVVERLVFHPDYTNADFIGQILPVVDAEKQVTYEFTSGPFTSILRDAYRHPLREYILIIEEVNRGNAPAIFGEVFQLLDRTVESRTVEGITYPMGTSEYGITHKYMAEKIYGDPTHKVRIPSNLSIVGTMNTSDQNVFTLDTAFQRRWRMRLIENNFDNVRESLANAQILDTEVTWKTFCDKVNGIIVGNKAKMASAEDKRLGVYFIHENDVIFDQRAVPSEGYASLLTEYNQLLQTEATGDMPEDKKQRLAVIREALMHNRMFPEKVIKYLWDDAFKFNPEALFDTDNMESLEQVIRTFVYSRGRERFKIFKPTVRASFYPDTQA